MSEHARGLGKSGSALLRAWLAAAHGEALAAAGRRTDSLRAFDRAAEVLLADCTPDGDGPYVALDEGHLARWRGHALARIGDPRAVPVLVWALRVHNTDFTRAEAALRVDLVFAFLAAGHVDSATALAHDGIMIADTVGSLRQRGRLANLAPS
jgi:hypothetical protein